MLIIIFTVAIILLCPALMTIINVNYIAVKKKSIFFDVFVFFFGMMLLMLVYHFINGGEYTKQLYINKGYYFHEAINEKYNISLYWWGTIGFFSYLILKYKNKKLSPIIEALLLAGVYLGIVLIVIFMIHLLPVFQDVVTEFVPIILYGILIYVILINFLMLMLNLVYIKIKEFTKFQNKIKYKNRFLEFINKMLYRKYSVPIVSFILMFFLFAIIILILTLFGQQPDSVIKAFTETSDWVLSQKTSPPPLEFEGHYLCTVSLRGHKKIVKPLRYGIRGNKKIVVNRQLCIANAFEDLIMERFPRFHRWIRYVYDKYGYPISKYIKKPIMADIVYIIMKPLEWIFLIVLYTFDVKPENRIARQYMPGLRNISDFLGG